MLKKLWLPLLVAISFLIFYLNFTSLGAQLDTRLFSVGLAVICTSWSVIRVVRSGSPLAYAITAVSLVLLWISIKEYFLLYEEQTIVFENQEALLEGSLYIPRNGANCLVLFLNGASDTDRREAAFHARQLARHGVAGFAYDQRGSGRSTGDPYEVGYGGYARDAAAALDQIQLAHFFDKVGLFGKGDGEWVSIIVNELRPVNFIVMASAVGLSPLKRAHREMTYRLERSGVDSLTLARADSLYWDILSFDNDSLRRIALQKRIDAVKKEDWFRREGRLSAELQYDPWWYQVTDFDPLSSLSKNETPILVLIGKEDAPIPYEEIVENFSPFANVEVQIFTKGDHSLQEWKLGKGTPPASFVRGYLESYTEWIQQQCQVPEVDPQDE